MDFLFFDKYTYYILASYLLTFITITILFISAKMNHKNVITKLGAKYAREEK